MDILLIISLLLIFYICLVNFYKRRVIYYNDPLIKKIKFDVSKLDSRIANIDFYSSNESYTEDKKKIFLCLKDENGKYYDYNMLIYVAIHECSHALTDVIDVEHKTPEFRGMFEYLLNKASQIGIYDPHAPLRENYCGVSLDTKNMQR